MDKVIAEINSMKVSDFGECKKSSSDYVLIKVKDYGEIVIVLREDIAPITVKNFKNSVFAIFFIKYNICLFSKFLKHKLQSVT